MVNATYAVEGIGFRMVFCENTRFKAWSEIYPVFRLDKTILDACEQPAGEAAISAMDPLATPHPLSSLSLSLSSLMLQKEASKKTYAASMQQAQANFFYYWRPIESIERGKYCLKKIKPLHLLPKPCSYKFCHLRYFNINSIAEIRLELSVIHVIYCS